MSRLTALIDRMFEYDGRPCLEDGDEAYTYSQTLAACLQCDASFDSLQIRPGCVIGLQADYSLTSAAVLLAALLRACIVVLIPKDRDVSACVDEACVEELLSVDAAGQVQRSSVGPPRPCPLLDESRAAGHGGVVRFSWDDSGRPVAALQSIENLLAQLGTPERPVRTLGFLMLDGMAGLEALFYTFSSGGSFIVARACDPDSILALIESHRVELVIGCEPLDADTLGLIHSRFPHVHVAREGHTLPGITHELRNGL